MHSTANPGATARNHRDLWARDYIYAVHLVSDWAEAIHTVPYDRLCYQVGNGNRYVEGLEICEATNAQDFQHGIEIAALVVRERLAAHGWGIDRLICHDEATKRWGGSDHTDPIPYFSRWGYSWERFKQLVKEGDTGVSAQDLYETKGNDGRNLFDGIIQTRNELKDRATDALIQTKGNDGRNILDSVIQARYDIAELKTMIDAIASSKFIPEEKSDALIKKVTALAGIYKARDLKRNVVVDGRGKLENKQIFYIIDTINEAINQHKKIRFRKIEYNVKKERVLHHGGEKYTFSPYSLVWDGDNYYVVGYSDKYENIGSHRVDRIAEQPEILDEPAVPPKAGFSVEKYVKTTFRMYNAPRKEVELLCDNGVMDAIIDQFGPDVHTYAGDLQNFRVIEEVAVGKVFFNWIFGFEGKVRIKAPADVKEQYRQMVENAAKVL